MPTRTKPAVSGSGAANGRFYYCKNDQLDLNPSVPQKLWAQLLRRACHIDDPRRLGGIWRLENGRVQQWSDIGLVKDFGPFPWLSAPATRHGV